MAGQPTRLDLLRFSYGEVLDATKHQDDKVGRLLGAVAFITGGALVFADATLLKVEVAFPDAASPQYPLGAILLGAFLVLDLVAVASFLIAMSAPLKVPETRSGDRSLIYFRSIVAFDLDEWEAKWRDTPTTTIEDDLPAEIMNISKRADRKYGRTTIATNIFLGALALLAPSVVLGLVAATTEPNAVEWTGTVRWYVAVSVGAVALALLVPLGFRAADPDVEARPNWFWGLVASYALTLFVLIKVEDGDSYFRLGYLPAAVLGACSALLALVAYTTPARALLHAAAIAGVVVAGLIAWANDRPDVQLYVAIAGCVVIVLPNIIDELTHNRGDDAEDVAEEPAEQPDAPQAPDLAVRSLAEWANSASDAAVAAAEQTERTAAALQQVRELLSREPPERTTDDRSAPS